jgi:fructokinase
MFSIVGEALVDLADTGDHRSFIAHPGGSPLNVAIGLARLGQPTALLARISTDAFGRMLRGHARANNVDTSVAPEADEPTTLAVASIDDDGQASYAFYLQGSADWQWTDEELAALPRNTAFLHTGSLAAWTPPGGPRIAALRRRIHDAGAIVTSYDPNVRPALLKDREHARALIEADIASAHIVKASEEDLGWLYPLDLPRQSSRPVGRSSGRGADADLARIAARWLDLGPELVIVTQGGAGATAYTCATMVHVPAPPIRLVDTVGAGDAFTSGMLSGLAEVGVRSVDDLRSLLAEGATALEGVLDRATRCAALTCERAGADPPTLKELKAAP